MQAVKIHTPQPTTTLPAYEQAARTCRRRTGHLAAIPGYRAPRTPRPSVHTGRKTFHPRHQLPCELEI